MQEDAPIIEALDAVYLDGALYCSRCVQNEETVFPGDNRSDSPCHCDNGPHCKNAIRLSDGRLIGALLDGELTTEGENYVAQTEGEVGALWREFYGIKIAKGVKPFEGRAVNHIHWSKDLREDFEKSLNLDAGTVEYLEDFIALNLFDLNRRCAYPTYPGFATIPPKLFSQSDADLVILACPQATVFPLRIVNCAGYNFRLQSVEPIRGFKGISAALFKKID